MLGLTVLVVDRDPWARASVISALRALGLHALGAYVPSDAVALLDGITADVVLVRGAEYDQALRYLRHRAILVHVPESSTVEESVHTLLRHVGAPGTRPN